MQVDSKMKRTKIVFRSLSPQYEDTLHFDISSGAKGDILIQCKHSYQNVMFTNKVLGEVRIPLEKVVAQTSLQGTFTLQMKDSSTKGRIDTGTLDLSLSFSAYLAN